MMEKPTTAGMRVFTCPTCGVPITRPLELLETPPPPPPELLGNDGDKWVPVGRFLSDSGPYAEEAELPGGPIIHKSDLVGTARHPEKWRWADGCCGSMGSNGPNVVCANGHEVGTEVSDCHTLNRIWLLTPEPPDVSPPG